MDIVKSYANIALGFILVTVIGFGYWKISSTISNLEEQVIKKEAEAKGWNDKYNDSQRDLALEQANVITLESKMDVINLETNVVKSKLEGKMRELEEWKSKPVEIKYVDKVRNIIVDKGFESDDCKEGLRLIQTISKLKYEEL